MSHINELYWNSKNFSMGQNNLSHVGHFPYAYIEQLFICFLKIISVSSKKWFEMMPSIKHYENKNFIICCFCYGFITADTQNRAWKGGQEYQMHTEMLRIRIVDCTKCNTQFTGVEQQINDTHLLYARATKLCDLFRGGGTLVKYPVAELLSQQHIMRTTIAEICSSRVHL